jgi:Xaa-Pro aminopeptidase
MQLAATSHRISRAQSALARQSADWLLLPASPDFRWLTGAHARSTERLIAFALPRSGEPFCVVPRLEAESLAAECPWLDLEVWEETDSPFERLARRIDLTRRPTVLVGEGFRVAPLLRLAAEAACRPASTVLAPLRASKDADELDALARAAKNADRVVEEIADRLRPGMTEREVARLAMDRFVALGDTEPWAIAAFGPHSALPHHMPSDRKLAESDVAILDVGAYTDGYGSDITRTYVVGKPPADFERVYGVVRDGKAAGIAAVRARASAESVDRAARAVIDGAGFGPYFTHRTGHGVGLEVHEPPYLVAGNREPLEPGMVHSVEPGIYLPGRFGVRLEDLVVVEEGKARVLNHAPQDPRPPRARG